MKTRQWVSRELWL